MSDEEARLRRQVSLLGEESLNRLDKWRWKQMEQADERKRYIARQERIEQERAAAAAAADEVAELRAV
jgi:hypothetical protein